MTKFKLIRLYKQEDVPDYLLEEVNVLIRSLSKSIYQLQESHAPSLILSALNRAHAAYIVNVMTEAGLKSAAETEAVGLIRNIEHISGQTILKSAEDL